MNKPMCFDCCFGRWVRGLPATHTDPPEPGYYECEILEEDVPEGQEPFNECRILDAYNKGYDAGYKYGRLDNGY